MGIVLQKFHDPIPFYHLPCGTTALFQCPFSDSHSGQTRADHLVLKYAQGKKSVSLEKVDLKNSYFQLTNFSQCSHHGDDNMC